jgi:MFS superfamily sulfate permease-like transporter
VRHSAGVAEHRRLRLPLSRVSGLVVAACTVLTLLFLTGLFIGVVVSLLLLLYRASRPHVAVLGQVPGMAGQYGDLLRHPENTQTPAVVLLRVEGGLFFANADTVRDVLRRAEDQATLPRAYPNVQAAVDAVAGPKSPGTG